MRTVASDYPIRTMKREGETYVAWTDLRELLADYGTRDPRTKAIHELFGYVLASLDSRLP